MTVAPFLQKFQAFVTHAVGAASGVTVVLFLLVYAGVILPAVWSRRSYRRAAAHLILTTLMEHLDTVLQSLRRTRRR